LTTLDRGLAIYLILFTPVATRAQDNTRTGSDHLTGALKKVKTGATIRNGVSRELACSQMAQRSASQSISADGDLDAPVAQLGNSTRRRYKRIVRPVVRNFDDIARNARCNKGGAHGLGASEGQRPVIGIRAHRVGMTDNADIGIGCTSCRSDRSGKIAARPRVELCQLRLKVEYVDKRCPRRGCESAGELGVDV
jgi:hypothetical protein